MKLWHIQVLSVIREAHANASLSTYKHLHIACSRTIVAMVTEGGKVPSELLTYARQIRDPYAGEASWNASAAAPQFAG